MGFTGVGLGHDGIAVLFKNVGPAGCLLSGYPGVAGLNGAGQPVVQAVRTPSGYMGGLSGGATTAPSFDLEPGQTASALVEGTDNPQNGASSCPEYQGLLVTPPGTTTSVRLKVRLAGCSTPQVHPVVPGTTGHGD